MNEKTKEYSRRSIRLRGHDYTQNGAYFVTICVQNRECRFGNVVNGEMRLNEAGQMVAECWKWLETQYPYVRLDEWVVMPNHLHGIPVVHGDCRGDSRIAPTVKIKTLGRLIGAFKTFSARRLNEKRGALGTPVWQRNYYEHVVRNERELGRVREYIASNPPQWESDRENPLAVSLEEEKFPWSEG